MSETKEYYVPSGSYWPFVGSIAIAVLFHGFLGLLNQNRADK